MKYNPDIHRRKSLRLKGWIYSGKGAYFITICSWRRECIFIDENIKEIINAQWNALPGKFQNIQIDEFVLLPNHLHGILWINREANRSPSNIAPSLGDIICAFKSKTAVLINRTRDMIGSPIWQRNYYEHIVRDENELNKIRTYIMENPLKWDEDEENPNRIKQIK